jgi:hypothetical protein
MLLLIAWLSMNALFWSFVSFNVVWLSLKSPTNVAVIWLFVCGNVDLVIPYLWLVLCDINDGCVWLWLCLILLLVDALDFTILIVSDGRGHAGPVDFTTRLGSPMMSLGIPVAVLLLLCCCCCCCDCCLWTWFCMTVFEITWLWWCR